jgi:signal transduction histidine kinase
VFPSQAWIEDVAERVVGSTVRVAIFSPPPLLLPIADSSQTTSRDIANDPLVARAASSPGSVSGVVTRGGVPYAEAASAFGPGQDIVLLSMSLHSDAEAVSVMQRRVIIAALVAVAVAVVLGYALASLFARRIRRLEAAAGRIAEGHFDEVIDDDAPDELGQLARAFELMRQRLASLDRARGEFIANASHELRTPLFSLAGFLELLTGDDELDAATRDEFLAAMRDQVTRLTRLATVLLDLSRLDAGKLSLEREPVDLNAVAAALASEFGPRAAAGGHGLAVTPAPPVSAFGDETRVLEIGRIFVENAIVHTPPGSAVEVTVGTRGGAATLAVTDDGPGIPDSAQEAVFERFYRLSGTVASGSGLGLSIARALAERMEGRVEVDSVPGRTEFVLVLALEAAREAPVLEAARGG